VECFVIADEDTVLGFRYAGVEGQAVRTPDEARAALAEQLEAARAGLIIMTDDIANELGDEISRLRFKSRTPLVVQIPGPDGPEPDRPDLLGLIREAVGIRF